ncbi:hypothetical protein C1645_817896 [Glomus cerebriforme]|uniref:Uncharacterized protein n=1 Tax=Glomus cerebriforme TaxID=658196 RepID=A0A397TI60_9GLOM|nr:hypothetical protein C1645_817896 [Glomus cerebriforme]
MDNFLDSEYKKNVSNEIRQCNKEKKFLHESKLSESTEAIPLSTSPMDKEARSHKKKEAKNIVQDVFDFSIDESDKNHMMKFSLTAHQKNSDILKNISHLYEDTCNTDDEMIKANQAEMLCWVTFINGLDKSINKIMIKEKVGIKKAKGWIYDFILAHNPDTKRVTYINISVEPGRFMNKFFNEVNPTKVNTVTSDDDVYFDETNKDNMHDGDSNSCSDDSDPDSNSGDEMPDDSDR